MNANYPNDVQDIVERVDRPVRIVQLVPCYNEKDFIHGCISHLYDQVDRLIILEGAIESKVPGGSTRSTDGTCDIIQDFKKNHDPGRKISLIQLPRAFKNIEEQKQIGINLLVDNDIALWVEADERIHPEEVPRVRRAFDLVPQMSEIIVLFAHHFRDPYHIRKPRYDWQVNHQRIFRYRRGYQYKSHPVVSTADGHCTFFSPHFQSKRFNLISPLIYFHYGYSRPNMRDVMLEKQAYYSKELEKFGAVKEFDEKVNEFLNFNEDLREIGYFPLEDHPKCMQDHSIMQYHEPFYEGKELVNWREFSPFKEAFAGESLPTIYNFMSGKNPRMPMFRNSIKI